MRKSHQKFLSISQMDEVDLFQDQPILSTEPNRKSANSSRALKTPSRLIKSNQNFQNLSSRLCQTSRESNNPVYRHSLNLTSGRRVSKKRGKRRITKRNSIRKSLKKIVKEVKPNNKFNKMKEKRAKGDRLEPQRLKKVKSDTSNPRIYYKGLENRSFAIHNPQLKNILEEKLKINTQNSALKKSRKSIQKSPRTPRKPIFSNLKLSSQVSNSKRIRKTIKKRFNGVVLTGLNMLSKVMKVSKKIRFIYSFEKIKHVSSSFEIQINFADEYRRYSLKRRLFQILKIALDGKKGEEEEETIPSSKVMKSKRRFMRNFLTILKHVVERKVDFHKRNCK